MPARHRIRARSVIPGLLTLWAGAVVLVHAQTATPQFSPASQRPPETVTPQSYPPEQIETGRARFASQCGFCHGRDAAGGEGGPDLTRSTLVAQDVRGDALAPTIRSGRPDKGMPAFSLSEGDLAAIVAFVHDAKNKAESVSGGRRSVDVADLQSGDAERGRRYFHGAGGCVTCHSIAGTFATVGSRFEGLALLQRMLYPGSGRNATPATPPTVTVTTPSGQTLTGTLASRDEFTIAITDADGWNRSWPASQVKVTVQDSLRAHADHLSKYTDDTMHDVLAYLQTLREPGASPR